ncbi:hypothetical protein [Absidia glauca]|uniref:Uncharacterized protein n=1 Tax=Absidia glauca TaxID=4829 RepID=A0A163JGP8_ABSGL|nr:hypothetical protein [Absidia glauca]
MASKRQRRNVCSCGLTFYKASQLQRHGENCIALYVPRFIDVPVPETEPEEADNSASFDFAIEQHGYIAEDNGEDNAAVDELDLMFDGATMAVS